MAQNRLNIGPELEKQVDRINGQLQVCRLVVRGRKFSIRATFPPRPGGVEPIRTHLPTNCIVSPAGLKAATDKARSIDADLLAGRFDWTPYLKGKLKSLKPAETVGDWIEAYTKDHWDREDGSNPNKQNSYKKNYQMFFDRLPQSEQLTEELLIAEIKRQYPKPGSRSRQVCAMAYAKLAEFAKLQYATIRELGKGYSPRSVDPRNLPTDEEILDLWSTLENPGWRFGVALLAVYGLRSHEIFKCRTDRLKESVPVLEIDSDSKTGRRVVFPIVGDGWDAITAVIQNPVYPPVTTEGKSNNDVGDVVGAYLRLKKWPFTPLDFRHAYARRCYKKGFDSGFAAKSMGHSRQVHEHIYSAWWGEEPYMEKFIRTMEKQPD